MLPVDDLRLRFDILRTEYIKLLNDKDVLINWGKPQLEALYSTRIGIYQIELLQYKLRIQALKRKLEMARSAIARNIPIDVNAIELQVAAELADAELRIMKQVAEIEKGKKLLTHLDSPTNSADLRKCFREMAMQLHPDVNPNITEEQKRLWELVKEAYNNGDLQKLKALQVVYEKELTKAEGHIQQMSEEDILLRCARLSEGINLLNDEITAMRLEFPFNMEQQIKDEDWIAAEQEKINAEIILLRDYEAELISEYRSLIDNHGTN